MFEELLQDAMRHTEAEKGLPGRPDEDEDNTKEEVV